MENPSFYIRNMHKQYGRQLQHVRNQIKAQRLARFRQSLNETPSLYGPPSPERRQLMVEWVARELFENLMFTSTDNPVVNAVREELTQTLQATVHFRYPPGSSGVLVLREEPQGLVTVGDEEREAILDKVWQIILKKVDETML